MRNPIIVCVVGVALLAGCGASQVSSQSPATMTVTVSRTVTSPAKPEPKPAKPPQIARPSSLKTFPGKYFSVEYPGAWYVDTAETDKGGYLDTTIRNGHNPEVMVRVDVTPATAATAATDRLVSARRLEDALRLQPDYRRLELRRFTFHGLPAVRWEFEVTEDHVLLHKVDTFFTDGAGDGVAILTQAPASTYVLWRRLFEQTRASLQLPTVTPAVTVQTTPASPTPSAPAPPPEITLPVATTETDFCATHACIPNFDNGTGTIVQCADGMWSHSGGRPGACSYHGGEAAGGSSGGYDDGSGATQDYGSGNGYPVTCADGTLSDSGGIQGACSHHGGVG